MKPFKERVYSIIFQSHTKGGRIFDIYLLIAILTSSLLIIADSVPSLDLTTARLFFLAELVINLLFTAEYALRIYCAKNRTKYLFSFYGIIDFISIFSFYFILFLGGSYALVIIRILRLLRIFRILNMNRFVHEAGLMVISLRRCVPKILIFMLFVFLTSMILGSIMYVFEGGINPAFSSIPKGIYWAIVTLTTVGYGDITPLTNIGQFFSTIIMMLGYSVLAVPTGIISAEMVKFNKNVKERECPSCGKIMKCEKEDLFCKYCGVHL